MTRVFSTIGGYAITTSPSAVTGTTFTQSEESMPKKSCSAPVRGERARTRCTENTRQSWSGSISRVVQRRGPVIGGEASGFIPCERGDPVRGAASC